MPVAALVVLFRPALWFAPAGSPSSSYKGHACNAAAVGLHAMAKGEPESQLYCSAHAAAHAMAACHVLPWCCPIAGHGDARHAAWHAARWRPGNVDSGTGHQRGVQGRPVQAPADGSCRHALLVCAMSGQVDHPDRRCSCQEVAWSDPLLRIAIVAWLHSIADVML